MTADQLIQQYDAGATTARELVEGVWDAVIQWNIGCPDQRIRCFIRGREQWSTDTETEAVEFTRGRLEKIRQVKEEVGWIGREYERHNCPDHMECIREQLRIRRILTARQAALADLCQGIKPEVLQ
jgi:hypothetical protein